MLQDYALGSLFPEPPFCVCQIRINAQTEAKQGEMIECHTAAF